MVAARAQVYLRAGWSLGLQKRYIYEGNGTDRQCGRAATGLTVDAVRSPPQFAYSNRRASIVLRRRSSDAYRRTLVHGMAQRSRTRNGSTFCPDLFITQNPSGPPYHFYWPHCSTTTTTFIQTSIRSIPSSRRGCSRFQPHGSPSSERGCMQGCSRTR